MNHLTEEQLVFHYYGEEGETLETERHLDECEECRALYGSLQRALNVLDAVPVPARGPEYGTLVWRKIEAKLARRRWWMWEGPPAVRLAFASTAMVALLAVAFLAGRAYPPRPAAPPNVSPVAADTQGPERILRVAMGDYLERSQMVLIELANANAKGSLDISSEQERAQELISETRLYRQTAATTGNTSVSGILDELERLLLDIAHGPSQLSPGELKKLRARLAAESILFKIRVVNSNVRSQEEAPAVNTPGQKL